MIKRIVSNKFFNNPKDIDDLLNHPEDGVNVGIDFKQTADPEWLHDHMPWVNAIEIALKFLHQMEKDFYCDRQNLISIWVKRNVDVWDIDNHAKHHRENSDIHKDYFEGYSKTLNLQVYISEDIPPEAGTCFWTYTGDNIAEDTNQGNGNSALWPYNNWKLIEQIPFEPNLAFSYNAGPDGVWHSAPTTEMLLDNSIPSHKREVIIFRFRYK